jgi:single-strand DNA-binding protein
MINKVILVGNLGRDPEVRSTPSGQPVATFTVATSRRWRDKNGQKQEQTEWHQVVCWGKQAEIAGQYLTKGKQIFVEGRLQTRSWDDRNTGEKRYRTEVICDNFQMLGQRGGDFEGGQERYSPAQSQGGAASSGPSYDEGGYGEPEEDDIPF